MRKAKTTERSNEILAEIALNTEHLRYVNEAIDEIYECPGELTDCNEAELDYLYGEKEDTQGRIKKLREEFKSEVLVDCDTCTGKIEIVYSDLPDDIRFDLYRYLNRLFFDFPSKFNYKTVENTVKYSKDFIYEDGDKQ